MKEYIPWVIGVAVLLASAAYSGITTDQKYLLNHMGHTARKVQLGDLIDSADTVTIDEIAIADGKIVVGNGSGAGAAVDMSGDATIANTGAVTIANSAVETAMIADDAVTQAKIADDEVGPEHIDEGQMLLDFTKNGAAFGGNGTFGVPLAAATSVNCVQTMGKHLEWYNDLQQDLGLKWVAGSGLNISGDQTDDDALQVGTGSTATDVAKTVGTDNFYFRAKVKIEDVSGTDDLYIGLRKVMAYDTTPGNYDDYYAVGFDASANPAEIHIRSNIGDAGEVNTDTTQTLADTQYVDVKIYVGEEAQLQTSIDLANALKTTINTHYADYGGAGEEHIAEFTTISTANATDYATLVALTSAMLTSYDSHDDDAELGSSWVYHQAQEAGDATLASAVAPTSLSECVTRLNDLKAKVNTHVADGTAHTNGDSGTNTTIDASTTWLQLGVNGAVADPTVGKAFDFDAAEVVMPFIYVLHSADVLGYVYVQNWEVVDTVTVSN